MNSFLLLFFSVITGVPKVKSGNLGVEESCRIEATYYVKGENKQDGYLSNQMRIRTPLRTVNCTFLDSLIKLLNQKTIAL